MADQTNKDSISTQQYTTYIVGGKTVKLANKTPPNQKFKQQEINKVENDKTSIDSSLSESISISNSESEGFPASNEQ
ncbi:MAG: hypothetical protein RCG15_03065 [Candidatus Rickettsia vulgarisii]